MKTIKHGAEYMKMDAKGFVSRPAIGMNVPSGQWRVTGAVQLNNFGYEVRRYTLDDILNDRVDYFHKNGKQKVHITDFDHGAMRIWMNPKHEVLKGA